MILNESLEKNYLLKLIRYVLQDRTIAIPEPELGMNWDKLIQLAQRHSILNLIFYGVEKLPLSLQPDREHYEYLRKSMLAEIIKSNAQLSTAEELLEVFEQQGVYAVALKGINTKQYYPQADMRSMGDIDILYKDSQQRLVKSIMEQLGCEGFIQGRKHDKYYLQPFINIEMHRELVTPESAYSWYYQNIWEKVHKRANCRYIHEMMEEDAYIYTILHLIEHFKNGGVGIRFIMDVFVYNHNEKLDWEYLTSELKKLDVWKFFCNISNLAEMWFGAEKQMYSAADKEILDTLAAYVLNNGTYGTLRNAAALSVEKQGRIIFLLKVCFPGLHSMQSMYPWLKCYPFLLPWGWILRGIQACFFRKKNVKSQLDVYKYGDRAYGRELRKFYRECGLEYGDRRKLRIFEKK